MYKDYAFITSIKNTLRATITLCTFLAYSPCYTMDTKNSPDEKFEKIPLVGFHSTQHLDGLCLMHYALENYKPSLKTDNDMEDEIVTPENISPKKNNQALVIQQRNILNFLGCIQRKSFPVPQQIKLLSLLTTLKNRANKNFVSPHYNIISTYNTIIDFFHSNLETRLNNLPDTQYTHATDYFDLDLVPNCNKLAEKLNKYHTINSYISELQPYAIEKISKIMHQLHNNTFIQTLLIHVPCFRNVYPAKNPL